MKKLFVYALCEPVDGFHPRYVGLSKDVEKRLKSHRSSPNTADMAKWFESIDKSPRVVILETLTDTLQIDGFWQERWWIQHLISQGHSLLNKTDRVDYRIGMYARHADRTIRRRVRYTWTKLFWQRVASGVEASA